MDGQTTLPHPLRLRGPARLVRSLPAPRDAAWAWGVAAATAAVAVFLSVQLMAWPPHEDETLALFVGRHDFAGMIGIVMGQRGGAPLHFVLAWLVAHLGGNIVELRVVSMLLAVASVPAVAWLTARVAGRTEALVAALLAAGSWVLLFHGVYGRMYSLFLVTSAVAYRLLVDACEQGGRRRWAWWGLATLVAIAAHPYGGVLLLSMGAYALVHGRRRWREGLAAFAAVAVLAIPFWRTYLVLARVGKAASPESRHLIFALPLFALCAAVGLLAVTRRIPRTGPAVAVVAVAALLAGEVAWTRHKTPQLFAGEAASRVAARAEAGAWLAATARRDDLLFGYDPLWLGGWAGNGSFPLRVVPRADPKLALKTLKETRRPLGRGLFVLDASDNNNMVKKLTIPLHVPEPAADWEVRAYGPFLVLRTRETTGTPARFLELAAAAERMGREMGIGDADVNADTVRQARLALQAEEERARSSSSSSR